MVTIFSPFGRVGQMSVILCLTRSMTFCASSPNRMMTTPPTRDVRAMETAQDQMNDFRLICNSDQTPFSPADAIALHANFASKLLNWLGKDLSGPRVVISHNAPVINPNSKYKGGPLTPAFNSLDMVEIIGTHQPAL